MHWRTEELWLYVKEGSAISHYKLLILKNQCSSPKKTNIYLCLEYDRVGQKCKQTMTTYIEFVIIQCTTLNSLTLWLSNKQSDDVHTFFFFLRGSYKPWHSEILFSQNRSFHFMNKKSATSRTRQLLCTAFTQWLLCISATIDISISFS